MTITNTMTSPTADYYMNIRRDLLPHIPSNNTRILDVGCAAGYFGGYLKQKGYAQTVWGIELDRTAAEQARARVDRVFCANLNQRSAADILGDTPENFDCIICADILEHLNDPWKVLHDLSGFLSAEGRIIVSLPNIRHWSISLPLVFRGEWMYSDAGILDRTHLRFFTRRTMIELFDKANLRVVAEQPLIRGLSTKIDRYSLHAFRELLAFQWVLIGMRNP
jgi:2-polyprenyl-3-methyl-5-hydroxy-6-metoxy-1,4-benzoquinol methylase